MDLANEGSSQPIEIDWFWVAGALPLIGCGWTDFEGTLVNPCTKVEGIPCTKVVDTTTHEPNPRHPVVTDSAKEQVDGTTERAIAVWVTAQNRGRTS